MRSPPKKYGNALGMRKRTRVCQRVARLILNRLIKPGFTLRKPSAVFEMIGNSATSVAHNTSATSMSLTQMMISGAIATTGVTCNRIAYGNRLASISGLCTNSNAIATPSTVASANASNVIFSVASRLPNSNGASWTSSATIADGDGTRYAGTFISTHQPCHNASTSHADHPRRERLRHARDVATTAGAQA